MKIIVFTDSKPVKETFAGLSGKAKSDIVFMSNAEFRKGIANVGPEAMVYLDISRMDETSVKKALRLLSREGGLRYGLIDPQNSVSDVAALFHEGACDYIGRTTLKSGINRKRLMRALSFKKPTAPPKSVEPTARQKGYRPAKTGWDEIRSGREYTFCFMFIELDNLKESKKTFGDANLSNPIEPFLLYVERCVKPAGGRVWMRMDYGAIVLFPFGGTSCEAVLTCFKMILGRKLFSVEESGFNAWVSYRIALHIGDTIYHSIGATGTLVSDSLNSIFHLGQRFTPPGQFYLTEEVFGLAPPALQGFFVPAGEFEGRNILRMRLPL